MQDLGLQGPRNATTPRLEDCTPYSDDHAACWGWWGAGAISARPRMIPRTAATPYAMPHSVLSTVLDHCTPAIWGKTTTSTFPCVCTLFLLVTIKGGGGLPLKETLAIIVTQSDYSIAHNVQHPILALASINFSSSRDLGASLPLSPRLYPLLQAPPVQDNTVPSHTPLLDVRPRGRNQNKPVRYCVASCINIWDKKTRSITSWGPNRQVRMSTNLN